MVPTNGLLVQTSGCRRVIVWGYWSAGIAQAGASVVHAFAFTPEPLVALRRGFFGGAALVGDFSDALAGLVGLGAVVGAGLALGPGVSRTGGQRQAQGQRAGDEGEVGDAVWGHGWWRGGAAGLVQL